MNTLNMKFSIRIIIYFSSKKLDRYLAESKEEETYNWACFGMADIYCIINFNNKVEMNQEEYKRIEMKYLKMQPYNSNSKHPLVPPQHQKNIGRIVKSKNYFSNSSSSSKRPQSQTNFIQKRQSNRKQDENIHKQLIKYKDSQFLNKIKYSQMMNYDGLSDNIALKQIINNRDTQGSMVESYSFKKRRNSISQLYETNYEHAIQCFQIKKKHIDHKIQSLKKESFNQKIAIVKELQRKNLSKNNQNIIHNQRRNIIAAIPFNQPQIMTSAGKSISQKVKQYDSEFTLKEKWSKKQAQWRLFIQAMKDQMVLQQKLRKLKQNISKGDQMRLFDVIKKKHNIQTSKIKLQEQQFDPFLNTSPTNINQLAHSIVETLQACQKHWEECLEQKFQKKMLQDIFIELSKGSFILPLKDFVRQFGIILHNQKYLRNRDLFRIYKRVQPFSKENFVKKLGKN